MPERRIVVGHSREHAEGLFVGCSLAGKVTNGSGVKNEEAIYH